MTENARPNRLYAYRLDPFFVHLFIFLICVLAYVCMTGLFMIARSLSGNPEVSILQGASTAVVSGLFAGVLAVRIRRSRRSSGSVAFFDDKLQRPLTRGDDPNDYIPLTEVFGMEFDKDYKEQGPALILHTTSGRIAYECTLFESDAEFEHFRDRCKGLLPPKR